MSSTSKDKENFDNASSTEATPQYENNSVTEDNIISELLLHEDISEWTERGYITRKAIPASLTYLLQTSLQTVSVLA
ncbi:16135_t:CDS:1, partial [Racocetra fulgida]